MLAAVRMQSAALWPTRLRLRGGPRLAQDLGGLAVLRHRRRADPGGEHDRVDVRGANPCNCAVDAGGHPFRPWRSQLIDNRPTFSAAGFRSWLRGAICDPVLFVRHVLGVDKKEAAGTEATYD